MSAKPQQHADGEQHAQQPRTGRRMFIKGAGVATGAALFGSQTVAADDGDDDLTYSEDPWDGDAPWVEEFSDLSERYDTEDPIGELFDDDEDDDDDTDFVDRGVVTSGGAVVGAFGGPKGVLAGTALGYSTATVANGVSDWLYGRFSSGDEIEVSIYQHAESIAHTHQQMLVEVIGNANLQENGALSDAHFNAMVAERKGESQSVAESKALTSVQDWMSLRQSNELVSWDSFIIRMGYLREYLAGSDDASQLINIGQTNSVEHAEDEFEGLVPVAVELVNGYYHEGYALKLDGFIIHPYCIDSDVSGFDTVATGTDSSTEMVDLLHLPDDYSDYTKDSGDLRSRFRVRVDETSGNDEFTADPMDVIEESLDVDDISDGAYWSMYFFEEVHDRFSQLRDEGSNIVDTVYEAGVDDDIDQVIPPGVYSYHISQESAETGSQSYSEALAYMMGLDHQPAAAMEIEVGNDDDANLDGDYADGTYEAAQLIADWRPDDTGYDDDTFYVGETYEVYDDGTTFVVYEGDMLTVHDDASLTIVENLNADGEELDKWQPEEGNQVARDTDDLEAMLEDWINQQERVQTDDDPPGGLLGGLDLQELGLVGAVLVVLYGAAKGFGSGAARR